ncbi:nestin [Centrocercus urophasianus]|uniref:nestin n=1 Tax=Centrocercus urophasianus TaxID=9002 RepID=UPI001C64D612|nr:nestin [Centrocercus urophasianus]
MLSMEGFVGARALGEESLQMWDLNKRLEAYLARVKYLEEENEGLRAEIQSTKESPAGDPRRARYEEELRSLRDALHRAFTEKCAAELARDNLYEEVQHVRSRCQKEQAAREEAKRQLSSSKKELEEERRAQIWLKERAVQLEKEVEALLEVHEEEKAGLDQELASFSQSLEGFRCAPVAFQPVEVEDYSKRLSEIWRGAVETYKAEVAQLERALGQAKENLWQVAEDNQQSQMQLRHLEKELVGLKVRKEMLEESLGQQWQEQHGEAEKFQLAIEALEQEKQSLQVQIAQVLEDRQQLMHLKMSLSLEVATYRTLLEAESTRLQMPPGEFKLANSLRDVKLEVSSSKHRASLAAFPRPEGVAQLCRTPGDALKALTPKNKSSSAQEFQKINSVLQAPRSWEPAAPSHAVPVLSPVPGSGGAESPAHECGAGEESPMQSPLSPEQLVSHALQDALKEMQDDTEAKEVPKFSATQSTRDGDLEDPTEEEAAGTQEMGVEGGTMSPPGLCLCSNVPTLLSATQSDAESQEEKWEEERSKEEEMLNALSSTESQEPGGEPWGGDTKGSRLEVGKEDMEATSMEALHVSEYKEQREPWSPSREDEECEFPDQEREMREEGSLQTEIEAACAVPVGSHPVLPAGIHLQEDFVETELKSEHQEVSLCELGAAAGDEREQEVCLEMRASSIEGAVPAAEGSSGSEEDTTGRESTGRAQDDEGEEEDKGREALGGEDPQAGEALGAKEIRQESMGLEEAEGMWEESVDMWEEHRDPQEGHGDLQEEKEDLGEEHRDLQEEHGDTQEEHGDLQEEYRDLQEEHGDLQEEHGDTQEEHGDLKEEYRDLQEEHGDLQEEHGDLQEEHGDTQEEHGDLQEEYRDLQEEHGDTQEEHGDLKEEYGDTQEEHRDLQEEHRDLQEEHGDLQEEHRDLQEGSGDPQEEPGEPWVQHGEQGSAEDGLEQEMVLQPGEGAWGREENDIDQKQQAQDWEETAEDEEEIEVKALTSQEPAQVDDNPHAEAAENEEGDVTSPTATEEAHEGEDDGDAGSEVKSQQQPQGIVGQEAEPAPGQEEIRYGDTGEAPGDPQEPAEALEVQDEELSSEPIERGSPDTAVLQQDLGSGAESDEPMKEDIQSEDAQLDEPKLCRMELEDTLLNSMPLCAHSGEVLESDPNPPSSGGDGETEPEMALEEEGELRGSDEAAVHAEPESCEESGMELSSAPECTEEEEGYFIVSAPNQEESSIEEAENSEEFEEIKVEAAEDRKDELTVPAEASPVLEDEGHLEPLVGEAEGVKMPMGELEIPKEEDEEDAGHLAAELEEGLAVSMDEGLSEGHTDKTILGDEGLGEEDVQGSDNSPAPETSNTDPSNADPPPGTMLEHGSGMEAAEYLPDVPTQMPVDIMKDSDILEIVEQALEFNQELVLGAKLAKDGEGDGDTQLPQEEEGGSSPTSSSDEQPTVQEAVAEPERTKNGEQNGLHRQASLEDLAEFTEEGLNGITHPEEAPAAHTLPLPSKHSGAEPVPPLSPLQDQVLHPEQEPWSSGEE